MKDNNMDEYDQRFRALAREAHYDLRETSVLMKFLNIRKRANLLCVLRHLITLNLTYSELNNLFFFFYLFST